MADIKQAAKWMQEGKRVRRPNYMDKGSYFFAGSDFIHYFSASLGREIEDALENKDLLADDWEIAE